MAQRPRVDSLSTFEDFWSQKREEVDEEGDIDVGEPGDAILPPDPAPHAPVHRRSRVPSEEDLSHAEDLLSVSHGERDTRGGGDSGHNSPSLTPALTARRLMGDASPIINPLGGAGRIPSHEDLKGKCSSRNLLCSPRLDSRTMSVRHSHTVLHLSGLGSVDLRSGSFGGEHNFLEMFEHVSDCSLS